VAHEMAQLLLEIVREIRLRNVQVLERRRATGRCVQVQSDRFANERCEVRLVLVVEGNAFHAPAPPLLVHDVAHEIPSCASGRSSSRPAVPGGSSGTSTYEVCMVCIARTRDCARALNSGSFSPARTRNGLPMSTLTGIRPDLGQNVPTGIASWAPTRATGTIGIRSARASAAAPGVNSLISPVRERVFSGKIISGTPCRSSVTERPADLPRDLPRSTG